jgi:hypothetical protein
VNAILARDLRRSASALQRQHLAAVVHLCGAGAAATYAQRGFRFAEGQRCGAHDPSEYLRRVDEVRREFAQLARAEAEPEDAAGEAQ